jgi:hydrogen cyanide synthase HcnC
VSFAAGKFDVAVIGGGLVGSALAWGLARMGSRVAVLDEGDIAYRASRGNFALVWVQGKGLGMPEYAGWTVRSSEHWNAFAADLAEETGIDVAFQRPGGFHLALSARELAARAALLERLHNQPDMRRYNYRMLDRAELATMLPDIGPDVAGASFCPLDGHVNSLRLLRALHAAMAKHGVAYLPGSPVESIERRAGEFLMMTPARTVRAEKVVLAAGIANARLGPMVGLTVPVRPQRGQIVVTERTAPFLKYPMHTIRQTDEGSVMLGDSQEEVGLNLDVGMAILSVIAERAIRMFPRLAGLNVVRTWAALRVMTKDGFPIYDQSETRPGAFVATCHSGVTLAGNHALELAPRIAEGRLPSELRVFSARRFDVPQAA